MYMSSLVTSLNKYNLIVHIIFDGFLHKGAIKQLLYKNDLHQKD